MIHTKVDNIVENYHGTLVSDPYRWLENIAEPEVTAWIKAQSEQTEQYLAQISAREDVRERLKSLWNYPRLSLPVKAGGWYFYKRNNGLQKQAILCKQKGLQATPEVVLDPNQWSADGTIALGSYTINSSCKYMAYTVSEAGSDQQFIKILNLETGEDLVEKLQWCKFSVIAWVGEQGFYYSRYPEPGSVLLGDENHYNQVYWHELGTMQSEDRLIYHRPDAKHLTFSPVVSDDEKYLGLYVSHGPEISNSFLYKKLSVDTEFIELFVKNDAQYLYLGNEQTRFYFQTNLDAPRGRIISIDIESNKITEVLAEQAEVISEVKLINDQFIISFIRDAHYLLKVYSKSGKFVDEIQLPSLGSVEGLAGKQQDQEVFIEFTSFLCPTVSYRYDFKSRMLSKFCELGLELKPENYQVNQIFYSSKDGTQIPMYIVHKKEITLTGDNPTILYGYGGFGLPMRPSFSASRLLWFENGGIFALANIRGGGEYGEKWHKAGMLGNKQNVFDDFFAAAEWLIHNNYTSSDHLAISGGSNGGLLVAACAVQRPELFKAVVCSVPVIDMLRYHKFTVGSRWIPEYGNAEENLEHFDYLYKYSPLHNVVETRYPAILITTAESDDRVSPVHAYKFAAMLQSKDQGDLPTLLRVESRAGHGHGKPMDKVVDEHTDIYTFLLRNLDVVK